MVVFSLVVILPAILITLSFSQAIISPFQPSSLSSPNPLYVLFGGIAALLGSVIFAILMIESFTLPARLVLLPTDFVTQLQFVKGVGPARAGMLASKGLRTVSDLVAYAPFRYEDRTRVKTIAQLTPGELATVLATVHSVRASRMAKRHLGLFEVVSPTIRGRS